MSNYVHSTYCPFHIHVYMHLYYMCSIQYMCIYMLESDLELHQWYSELCGG